MEPPVEPLADDGLSVLIERRGRLRAQTNRAHLLCKRGPLSLDNVGET